MSGKVLENCLRYEIHECFLCPLYSESLLEMNKSTSDLIKRVIKHYGIPLFLQGWKSVIKI